jgi:serine/threonine protein kinase
MPSQEGLNAVEAVTDSVADRSRSTAVDRGLSQPVPPLPTSERYILGEQIARGGMGTIYRATDATLGREVAIKVLQERFAADSATARRFTDEARIAAQLQHPGIPPIHDLGTFPDGRPFLAMKLIKGRTLEQLLRQQAGFAKDLIAIFEQICQAVGYAHAHDVVHRDLKPANVMVGAFGEVQIMDWGLAKVLAAGRTGIADMADPFATAAETAVRPMRGSDGETQAGSVLGTPAFMSPEQAIGAIDQIDKRSDVFGLGAVLCVILTGKPPYLGADAESTRQLAARAKLDDAIHRLDLCGAEPDLLDLCKRCLAAEKVDRFADAGEVAQAVTALRAAADERARRAELDWVRAEGEAREAEARSTEQRQRRRMLVIGIGIIALALAAGLSVSLWQMRRAIQAEGAANASARLARDEACAKSAALEAEQQACKDEIRARQQAFAALRSMTTNVVQNRLARGTVLTDDDRAFLRGVIAQFDAFAAIKGDDADSRAVRAEGRLRVGTMRSKLGEFKEAEQDYDQALRIQEQLTAEFPSHCEFRQELAKSHTSRGALRYTTGRLQEAEKDYDQALSIQTQLAADFPFRPEFRQELARSHNNRGLLLRDTARLKDAEKDYCQAVSIYKQLAVDFPSRPEYRQELATSHNNRGNLLNATARPGEAEKDYDEALNIRRQLVADFSGRPEFRQDLAKSHSSRGLLLYATRRLREAEKDFDQALSIQRQLAADFPSRPEFRQDLAGSHNSRGIVLLAMSRVQEAENDYDQALRIQKQLVADFPNRLDLRNALAGTCVNLANLHRHQRNWASAQRILLEGRPHHLAALEGNPRNPSARQFYRNHLKVLTEVHAALLEKDEAVRTAEVRRDLGWDPPADAYDAAGSLSRCIPIAAKHQKLNDQERKELARFYTDAALKLLRNAVSKGYKDVAHMKKDADLDPLRQRDDLQKLVAELEAKKN